MVHPILEETIPLITVEKEKIDKRSQLKHNKYEKTKKATLDKKKKSYADKKIKTKITELLEQIPEEALTPSTHNIILKNKKYTVNIKIQTLNAK